MGNFLHPTPTREEQQLAYAYMRKRRAFAHWPSDLDQALRDPWRARLINVNAWVLHQHRRKTQHISTPAVDLKRAAAGDRD
jgi:hypothetical protein